MNERIQIKYISKYDKECVSLASRYGTLAELRDDLHRHGYRSKSGLILTESHVSNFRRKDLGLRKVRYYDKPTYAGRNWITG